MKKICAFSSLFLFAGCTAPVTEGGDPFDARDPIKPVNEAVFDFNVAADRNVVKPVAETYHYVAAVGRQVIGSFLSNLGEPANMVNGILQLNGGLR